MENQLPYEVIFQEILPRVPAKSLVPFRCVCKNWCKSISSNPYFSKTHFDHWKSRQPGVIKRSFDEQYVYHDQETGEIFDLKLNELFSDKNYLIPFTSCYGLLLVQSVDWSNTHSIPFFYVCNPITRQFTKLPTARHWLNPCEIAFDPVTQRYKVVSWSTTQGCSIFTLGDIGKDESSWRTVSLPSGAGEMYSRAVAVNGALYWVALIYRDRALFSFASLSSSSSSSCIVCLDISKEEITKITMPEEKYDKPPVLVEMEGVLYAVFVNSEENLDELVIWKLDDWKKNTWSKLKRCPSSVYVYVSVTKIVAKDRLKLQNGILPVREMQRGYQYCIHHVNTVVSWDGKAFHKRRKWYSRSWFKLLLCALFYFLLFYFFLY